MTLEELEQLGARVAETRKHRGLTYRQVEKETGVLKATVHQVEHGGDPRLSTVLKLVRWIEQPRSNG